MQFDYSNMPGLGLRPSTLKSTVWNRTGGTVAIGEVVMSDEKGTQPEDSQVAGNTTNVSFVPFGGAFTGQSSRGQDGFPSNNVITPTTAGLGTLGTTACDPGYKFGVVTGLGTDGTGADNTKIEVTWQGPVLVKMAATLATPQFGVAIAGANGVRTATVTTAAGQRILGRLEQDTTTANTLALALWDGLSFVAEAAS